MTKTHEFRQAPMWLQLHNLPLNGMYQSCRQKIDESIGKVEDIDVGDDNVRRGSSLRIKVKIDLSK